jgi:DNA-binding NarL/FixJ family response regulator
MNPIRVVLVDDHAIVREGLSSMLSTQPDMDIVGEAGTGVEAVALIERTQPDVVLLDLEMPDMNGVAVLEQTRNFTPTPRVLILTAYGSDERILEAVRAGAKGYLLKEASLSEVLHAVRVVADGGSLLEPAVTERLLRSMERLLRDERKQKTLKELLTQRERDILTYIARGFSNKAIASEMHLAERTIKFYATILFEKLGVNNRTEAVAKALQEQLITL